PTWIPPEVKERLYPAENNKIRPEARTFLNEVEKLDKAAKKENKELPPEQKSLVEKNAPVIDDVNKAEAEGASWAFGWTTVMPAALSVIFGWIGLIDKLRGGYRAEVLTTRPIHPEVVHAAPAGRWPREMTR